MAGSCMIIKFIIFKFDSTVTENKDVDEKKHISNDFMLFINDGFYESCFGLSLH